MFGKRVQAGFSVKRVRGIAVIAAAAITLLCGMSSTAVAASPASQVEIAHSWSNEFPHCTQVINPSIAGQDPARTKVELPNCYRTAAQATSVAFGRPDLAAASDGEIAAFQAKAAVEPATATNAVAASQLVLSVVWKDADLFGGSNTFLTNGTNNPCTVGGTWYHVNTMPSGWDNVVSSIRAWPASGCKHQRYWDGVNLTNSYAYFNPTSQAVTYYNLGSWNDRISSIDWYL